MPLPGLWLLTLNPTPVTVDRCISSSKCYWHVLLPSPSSASSSAGTCSALCLSCYGGFRPFPYSGSYKQTAQAARPPVCRPDPAPPALALNRSSGLCGRVCCPRSA